jgi:hypothetical protein
MAVQEPVKEIERRHCLILSSAKLLRLPKVRKIEAVLFGEWRVGVHASLIRHSSLMRPSEPAASHSSAVRHFSLMRPASLIRHSNLAPYSPNLRVSSAKPTALSPLIIDVVPITIRLPVASPILWLTNLKAAISAYVTPPKKKTTVVFGPSLLPRKVFLAALASASEPFCVTSTVAPRMRESTSSNPFQPVPEGALLAVPGLGGFAKLWMWAFCSTAWTRRTLIGA